VVRTLNIVMGSAIFSHRLVLGLNSPFVDYSYFPYTGSGSLLLVGCAETSVTPTIEHRWNVSDILFIRKKAVKGCLCKVAIKKVLFNANVIYLDTLNEFWNENDLITENEAEELAEEYVLAYEEARRRSIRNC
jgi:hypothetical protein